jgi:predicted transcriptional regulator
VRAVLSVSLPPDLARDLSSFARKAGRNKSDIVKESIRHYLWEAEFSRTRRTLAAKARRRGVVTEEDLFKAVS